LNIIYLAEAKSLNTGYVKIFEGVKKMDIAISDLIDMVKISSNDRLKKLVADVFESNLRLETELKNLKEQNKKYREQIDYLEAKLETQNEKIRDLTPDEVGPC